MKHLHRAMLGVLAIWLAAVTCNLPGASPTPTEESGLSQQQLAETAAALVLTSQAGGAVSPEAATNTAAPAPVVDTPCQPMVTASLNANVRGGPGTVYDVTGFLSQGSSAIVEGKNGDASWWYIQLASAPGGHGWIAASVTTSSCIPGTLPVIPAPPTPTSPPPTATEPPTDTPPVAAKPDLIVSEFSITPSTPTMGVSCHVRVGAYNQGNAAAGQFKVVWYGLSTFAAPSCSWTVNHVVAHGGYILECDYVFASWYPVNKTSLAIVDVNDDVDESHEGNNQGTISPFGVAKP
jgi:hypothetical protein